MATIGRFISPAKIKAETFVDENVDEKTLTQSIIYCQEEYTKNILGTALYNEIKGQIEAGSLTADNTTLLQTYIQPALKWWVVYEAMDELHLKAMNKGIMEKSSDNSQPANLNDILELKNKYRNRAERMDQKTINFLCENDTTYPLYINPGTGADTIHPKSSTYDTGWYLGNSSEGYDTPTGNCCE